MTQLPAHLFSFGVQPPPTRSASVGLTFVDQAISTYLVGPQVQLPPPTLPADTAQICFRLTHQPGLQASDHSPRNTFRIRPQPSPHEPSTAASFNQGM